MLLFNINLYKLKMYEWKQNINLDDEPMRSTIPLVRILIIKKEMKWYQINQNRH